MEKTKKVGIDQLDEKYCCNKDFEFCYHLDEESIFCNSYNVYIQEKKKYFLCYREIRKQNLIKEIKKAVREYYALIDPDLSESDKIQFEISITKIKKEIILSTEI